VWLSCYSLSLYDAPTGPFLDCSGENRRPASEVLELEPIRHAKRTNQTAAKDSMTLLLIVLGRIVLVFPLTAGPLRRLKE
jgi:hypothetical protein